jgi:hypothetical protein
MNILAIEIPRADNLTVDLSDGRTIAVPLEWFPRLKIPEIVK